MATCAANIFRYYIYIIHVARCVTRDWHSLRTSSAEEQTTPIAYLTPQVEYQHDDCQQEHQPYNYPQEHQQYDYQSIKSMTISKNVDSMTIKSISGMTIKSISSMNIKSVSRVS